MKYANIVFSEASENKITDSYLYSSDARLSSGRVDENGLMDYLMQWDFGGESETDIWDTEKSGDPYAAENFPWGTSDIVYKRGEYVLSYNVGIGYAALCREIREG